jgi:hypothetical protein
MNANWTQNVKALKRGSLNRYIKSQFTIYDLPIACRHSCAFVVTTAARR